MKIRIDSSENESFWEKSHLVPEEDCQILRKGELEMPFETLKPTTNRTGRKSISPTIRITQNSIYINQNLNLATNNYHNAEIQVDDQAGKIRLIFKSKETASSRKVCQIKAKGSTGRKRVAGGVIIFKDIMSIVGLTEPTTVQMEIQKGNESNITAIGTFKQPKLKLVKQVKTKRTHRTKIRTA